MKGYAKSHYSDFMIISDAPPNCKEKDQRAGEHTLVISAILWYACYKKEKRGTRYENEKTQQSGPAHGRVRTGLDSRTGDSAGELEESDARMPGASCGGWLRQRKVYR